MLPAWCARSEPKSRARAEAIRALGELRNPAALGALGEVLLDPQSEVAVQIEAANALGRLGDDAAIEPLVGATALSRARERARIDDALHSPERRYREGFYINRISAEEYELRCAIAAALAQIGGERAVRALFESLGSEQGAMESGVKRAVKSAIADACAKMGVSSVPLLRECLKAHSADARQWAAHCLGEFGDASAIGALLGAVYDEREEFAVRQSALISLGRIGDARAISPLEDLTQLEHRGLAREAQQAAMAIRMRTRVAPHDAGA